MCKAAGDSSHLRYTHTHTETHRYTATHMYKWSRYSVTTRDTMATESKRRCLSSCPWRRGTTPSWRHYNPHSWPCSTVPQLLEYRALYSNMCIYCTRYLYDISRRDPSFSYVHIFAANVCNTISVCCQLNFQVVSDHTRPCV